jgi:hypothetical protein
MFLPLLRAAGRMGLNFASGVAKRSIGDLARIMTNSHGKKFSRAWGVIKNAVRN